ncbi:MAG: hypothetical protein J6V24_12030 [Clostridia bacterium]|nr:hypothetical protein [Clostridia bacterium]MBO7405683.1 hypothetical protein [Clostridia bacterium]
MRFPKEQLKKLGILFLNFVLLYGLLRLIIALAERTGQLWIYYVGTALYGAAVIALFVAFFILNGYTLNRVEFLPEDLPDRWSAEQKQAWLARYPENRAKAKRLLYFLLPLVVTLLISYIELSFFK